MDGYTSVSIHVHTPDEMGFPLNGMCIWMDTLVCTHRWRLGFESSLCCASGEDSRRREAQAISGCFISLPDFSHPSVLTRIKKMCLSRAMLRSVLKGVHGCKMLGFLISLLTAEDIYTMM